MAENPSDLHVLGITAAGRLWHTTRTPTAWTRPFVNVLLELGRPDLDGFVTDVAAARLIRTPQAPSREEGLILAVLTSVTTRPTLLFRSSQTGQWSRLGGATPIVGATRIAACCATADPFTVATLPATVRLHLAWTGNAGRLLTLAGGVGAADAGTGLVSDVELTGGINRGDLVAVALAPGHNLETTDTTAFLAAVSADGNLYSSVVRAGASGASGDVLLDVETQGAGEAGELVDVAIALQSDATVHYSAVTGDGRILLASRRPDGSWRRWANLEEADIVIEGGPWRVVTRGIVDFGTFERVALGLTTEGVHLLGVTSKGQLLHQLLPSVSQQFRDVELVGVSQDVGSFTSVAVA